jgi:hypothetical protein
MRRVEWTKRVPNSEEGGGAVKTISVIAVCGPICGDPDDADRLRNQASALLVQGEAVCLDFAGVTDLTGPFVMDVIGRLHGEFPADFLAIHLTWSGLSEALDAATRGLRERAIWFYSLPESMQERVAEAGARAVEELDL